MQEQARRFRRKVQRRHGSVRPGRRIAPELRAEAVEFVRLRRAEGAGLNRIAAELGVGRFTLQRWSEAKECPETEKPAFLPVRVIDAPPFMDEEKRFTVNGPCGVSIESMDLAAIAELMRRLA